MESTEKRTDRPEPHRSGSTAQSAGGNGNDGDPATLAPSRTPLGTIENWLQQHAVWLALALVAAGFVLRLLIALPTFLNPDEILHWLIAGDTTVADIWGRILNINAPHPPLYFLLLYPLNLLGASDFVLRLPSILAGTASLWVAYLWMRRTFNESSALLGIAALAFSPEIARISTEVRGYALLFLLVAAALYYCELAFQDRSVSRMWVFVAMLLLAVSVHYTAIWFAIAMGIYAVVRMLRSRPPPRFFRTWLAGQVAVAALVAVYYLVHISQLVGARLVGSKSGFLQVSYFDPGRDSLLFFPIQRTLDLFRYAFSDGTAGTVILILFVAAVLLLLWRGIPDLREGRRRPVLLLTLPLAVGCMAALVGLYPYGGTRHSLHLGVFAAVGAAFLLTTLLGRKLWTTVLAGFVLIPLWTLTARPPRGTNYISHRDQQRKHIHQAIDHIRSVTPSGGIVLSDVMTWHTLKRYLSQGEDRVPIKPPEGFYLSAYSGGYRLVSVVDWGQPAARFGDDVFRLAQAADLKTGEPLTVASVGWGYEPLPRRLSHIVGHSYPDTHSFGGRVAVFQLRVGDERLSDTTKARVRLVQSAVDSIVVAESRGGRRYRCLFHPAGYTLETSRNVSDLADKAGTFTDMQDILIKDNPRVQLLLPALVIREFASPEWIPESFRGFDSTSGPRFKTYRAEPIGLGADGRVGVFRLEWSVGWKLDSLAGVLAEAYDLDVGSTFWPTAYYTRRAADLASHFSRHVLSYEALYRLTQINQASLDDFLPAVALWVFDGPRPHPSLMSPMDDRESYVSGRFRFTLLERDADDIVGAYLIEKTQ